MRVSYLAKFAFAAVLSAVLTTPVRRAQADGVFSIDQNLTVEVLTADPSISVVVTPGPVGAAFELDGIAGIAISAVAGVTESGMGLITETHVEGFVVGPQPASFAAAFALSEGIISITNSSSTDITVALGFTFEFFVGLIAFDDRTTVGALLASAVFLDPTDDDPGMLLGSFFGAISFTGPGGFAFGDTFVDTVEVVLTPGTHIINVDPITIGFAAIPEPSTVLSAAFGLVVLAGAGLRRRARVA